MPFPGAEASARDIDRIEELLGLSPPKDVLDVGCGNGRHAVELARRGYRILGIDVAVGSWPARGARRADGRFARGEGP